MGIKPKGEADRSWHATFFQYLDNLRHRFERLHHRQTDLALSEIHHLSVSEMVSLSFNLNLHLLCRRWFLLPYVNR
jgi:hypothetical protein